MSIFNLSALHQKELPIIVVEGEIDAMSIESAGFPSVGLGSIVMTKRFVHYASQNPPVQPVLVCLDTDMNEQGQKAQIELLEGLRAAGIEACNIDIKAGCKDANEALVKLGIDQFTAMVQQKVKDAVDEIKKEAEMERRKYLEEECAIKYVKEFWDEIHQQNQEKFIRTGFDHIDLLLDGGLYPGLYVLGAISSLGKTTMLLQIADSIARSGRDVLIFSLEMSRKELIGKSISRLTLEMDMNIELAKTYRGVTNGNFYKSYSMDERKQIVDAVRDYYGNIAPNVFLIEGMGDIGAVDVAKRVANHICMTGRKPVVFLDYLQVLKTWSDPEHPMRALTDKQSIDASVTCLKRLTRDFDIPLMMISSFNRTNYNVPVNMSAFKESGTIEYSSDVVIGLQLQGVGQEYFDVNVAKDEDPRKIEAVILKNRNGRTGRTVQLEYFARFNYLRESAIQASDQPVSREALEKWQKQREELAKQGKDMPPERKRYLDELQPPVVMRPPDEE